MNDSSRYYFCRVRNACHIDTHEGAAEPADGQRNLTGGLFVHRGVMEPMTRGAPLPRLVSSSERMRLRGLIGAAVFERESTARSDTRYLVGHVFQTEWKVDGSGI
jgi:hypothetical protein